MCKSDKTNGGSKYFLRGVQKNRKIVCTYPFCTGESGQEAGDPAFVGKRKTRRRKLDKNGRRTAKSVQTAQG